MTSRRLPSVDAILSAPALDQCLRDWGRPLTREAIRAVQQGLRDAGPAASWPDWSCNADQYQPAVTAELQRSAGPPPMTVVNMTGTLIHSNLGRAPLAPAVAAAVAAQALGPTNLEFDLATGRRGSRERFVVAALRALTGAAAATVVNNGAAGLLLILNTLALQRQVPVSRGELIEIGGSFRLPEIMERAGCHLLEIGTTNRTRRSDYADAIDADTALLLKVHPSNYRIEGFTESVTIRDLASLAHDHGLPLVEDLGSGALLDYAQWGLPHEPTPAESLAAGADLVLVSGDKLLGGPQAGIIVGRPDLIEALNHNPLKRALRLDRLRLTALAETLKLYGHGPATSAALPVAALIAQPLAAVHRRAQRISDLLAGRLAPGWAVQPVNSHCEIGSGALPGTQTPSWAVALQPATDERKGLPQQLLAALRHLPTPVIGRIANDAVLLDCRAVLDEDLLVQSLQHLQAP